MVQRVPSLSTSNISIMGVYIYICVCNKLVRLKLYHAPVLYPPGHQHGTCRNTQEVIPFNGLEGKHAVNAVI